MKQLVYTPDDDIKVHEEGAIRLICRAFQSHENGLPEWLKNSADAYAREDTAETGRVIVVILENGRKGVHPSIACLDFAGMTSETIEQNFRIWADPEAAIRGGKAGFVQGGHGNGGKCYMTQMFEDFALIHAARRGQGNRYGVRAGSVRFGYIPNRAQGRDFVVSDIQEDLETVLEETGCSVRALPKQAQEAFRLAQAFTLLRGVGPKGYGNKIPVLQIAANLEEHPQMMRTLELCKVYLLANGKLFNNGKPLDLPQIEPMENAKEPRIIPIPELLRDPASEHDISTTDTGKLPAGTLTLRTSKVSMRYGKKGRHNVVFRARSGYIGYIPVPVTCPPFLVQS